MKFTRNWNGKDSNVQKIKVKFKDIFLSSMFQGVQEEFNILEASIVGEEWAMTCTHGDTKPCCLPRQLSALTCDLKTSQRNSWFFVSIFFFSTVVFPSPSSLSPHPIFQHWLLVLLSLVLYFHLAVCCLLSLKNC